MSFQIPEPSGNRTTEDLRIIDMEMLTFRPESRREHGVLFQDFDSIIP
jgi:hypothetical protein